MAGFAQYQAAYSEPFAITPSDTVNFARPTRGGIYVGTAGDVVAVLEDGSTVTFKTVGDTYVLPVIAIRVNATGTTASSLVGLY